MRHLICIISDNLKYDQFDGCPLIIDLIGSSDFISNYKNKELENVYYIIDGLETASILFEEVNFLEHKIENNIFWFYSKNELENSYDEKLKSFLVSEVFKQDISSIKYSIVFTKEKLFSLLDVNCKKLIIQNELNKIVYLFDYCYDDFHCYEIDLGYFNYISNSNCVDLKEYFLSIKQDINLKDFFIDLEFLKVKFKKIGLIDRKFQLKQIEEYFQILTTKNLEIILWYNLFLYQFLNIEKYTFFEETKKLNELVFSELFLDNISKFNLKDEILDYSPVSNILYLENYLSNIKIKSIDIDKYPDLNFPIKDNSIQYNYNGFDSLTGRMYPVTLNEFTSLQTLEKNKRDVLNADINCTLIEFDYTSFEFDILYQLAGKEVITELDFHEETIDYLFSGLNFINTDLVELRPLGKTINYSLIYGMNIERLIDEVILKEVDLGINNNILKRKIEQLEIFELIKIVENKIKQEKFIPDRMIFLNHFNRWVKVDKQHALLNYYVSSTAADILYLKMFLITKLLLKSKVNLKKNKILFQNHDSFLLQLENDILNETKVFENICEIMDLEILGLKNRYKFNYGNNWGNLK